MPFFTPNLYLKKPTETERIIQEDYNDNLDILDEAVNNHATDSQAHGLGSLSAKVDDHFQDLAAHGGGLSLYKMNKDGSGVFTECQWKRPDGTLAKKLVLSGGTSPYYTIKTVTYYHNDGTTVKAAEEYALTYDQDNDLISEVLQ